MFRISFTGHRNSKLPYYGENDPLLIKFKETLFETIHELVDKGAREFYCGMALGVDTYAAEAVLRLQKDYPDIELIAVVPCPNQDKLWTFEQRQRYSELLSKSSRTIMVSDKYKKGCMQKRNRVLVDICDVLIAAYDGMPGGTEYTINYAKRKGRRVIEIPLR